MEQHTEEQHTEQVNITTKGYITGFILAMILTALSFSLVMVKGINRHTAMAAIFIAAMVQMLVHLRYFLHLDRSSAARWNILVLVFTAVLLFIFIGGTLWVMYTLNSRMM